MQLTDYLSDPVANPLAEPPSPPQLHFHELYDRLFLVLKLYVLPSVRRSDLPPTRIRRTQPEARRSDLGKTRNIGGFAFAGGRAQ